MLMRIMEPSALQRHTVRHHHPVNTNIPYEFVVYIDESGDPGLRKVKPIDADGSSEWLVVSAVVIRRDNESLVDNWISEIKRSIPNFQGKSIHFQRLSEASKLIACSSMISNPLRIFVVASNKKNMRGHKNPHAELKSLDNNWFYCWMIRLLLERVTCYLSAWSIRDYGENQRAKIVFSNRGGLSYSQLKAYFDLVRLQTAGGTLFQDDGYIEWGCVDRKLINVVPHYMEGGLQLADIAASAFFKAIDKYDTKQCDPKFAKKLKDRVASLEYMGRGDLQAYRTYAGVGVKLMPSLKHANLLAEQREVFLYYGYPREWRNPAPHTPPPYSPTIRC